MKWVFIGLCFLFGTLCLGKGIGLWMLQGQWTGEEMTISFLGMEMLSGVNEESVLGYALGFSVAGLIPILLGSTIIIKTRYQYHNEQKDV